MRIHDPHTEAEEPYNLVPLTDMVFNLLIFFMCATTFVQIEKDLKVQLPKASSSFVPISAPPRQLIINIEQDGTTKVADKTYDTTALAGLVASAVKANADQTVIIRADERSIMKYFAGVASLCKLSGISEVKIGFLQQESSAK